jgi:hypothetical protein
MLLLRGPSHLETRVRSGICHHPRSRSDPRIHLSETCGGGIQGLSFNRLWYKAKGWDGEILARQTYGAASLFDTTEQGSTLARALPVRKHIATSSSSAGYQIHRGNQRNMQCRIVTTRSILMPAACLTFLKASDPAGHKIIGIASCRLGACLTGQPYFNPSSSRHSHPSTAVFLTVWKPTFARPRLSTTHLGAEHCGSSKATASHIALSLR